MALVNYHSHLCACMQDKHGVAYMAASPCAARALAVRCMATVNGWLAGQNRDSSLARVRSAASSTSNSTHKDSRHSSSSSSSSSSSRRNRLQGTARGSKLKRLVQEQSTQFRRLAAGGGGSRQCGSAVFAAEEIQVMGSRRGGGAQLA
eukprot:658901-Pelagomonas_calceolata.AAC.1